MSRSGSDAYQWIIQNTESMLETPDDAFDWVFMLTEDDWQLLMTRWNEFSVDAKEALAYIVCEGPPLPSREMLLRALRDTNTDVATQAAESLHSQRELYPEEFLPLDLEAERLVASLVEDDAT